MVNALRKELSKDAILLLSSKDLRDNIYGIKEIIFDEYLDGLPENYDAGEYHLNDPDYQTLNEILLDLEAQLPPPQPPL